MKLNLRTKLFMFVPVFALVPWLGYQTFQKLQHFATQAQSEALHILAQSLQPELDAMLRPDSQLGLRFAPEPMRRVPVLDGFFDEWPDTPYVLDNDQILLKIGQFDDQIAFALEVKDSTRFYQEPLFGRSEAAPFDAVRLRLLSRSSSSEILFATEGSGSFDGVISSTAPALANSRRIKAYWWEFSGGYRLEWAMPANDVVNRRLQLIQFDHHWI
ncbi:MAG TPA: hypothetical protein DCQ47_05650 [Gammaproteobacteria bacterium]|nr:hypothetical protein [Gammaproteobacteria bacterium]